MANILLLDAARSGDALLTTSNVIVNLASNEASTSFADMATLARLHDHLNLNGHTLTYVDTLANILLLNATQDGPELLSLLSNVTLTAGTASLAELETIQGAIGSGTLDNSSITLSDSPGFLGAMPVSRAALVAAAANAGSYTYYSVSGSPGNYVMTGGAGNDTINGTTGVDTASYSGASDSFQLTRNLEGTLTVADTSGAAGTDTLTNIERLRFSDARLALDLTGSPNACFDLTGTANPGQIYRLYQAAFNRTPDPLGLDYWIGQADAAVPLITIAGGFTGSVEFQAAYGNLADHQFVDRLYQNVLHRPGEAGGLAYWYSQLDSDAHSREQVLVGFSDSNENQAALIGVIQDGIEYGTAFPA